MYHLLCCVRYKKYSAFIEVVIGNTSAVCNIFLAIVSMNGPMPQTTRSDIPYVDTFSFFLICLFGFFLYFFFCTFYPLLREKESANVDEINSKLPHHHRTKRSGCIEG